MGIFDFLTKAGRGKPPNDRIWSSLMGKGSAKMKDKNPTELIQSYRGVVYGCVSSISELVATMQLKLYQVKKNGKRDEVESHPILDVLGKVNNYMTLNNALELLQQHMDLAGEHFWYVIKNQLGEPMEVWPLRPDRVTIYPSSTEFISGYGYTPEGESTPIPLERDEVVHFKYFDPDNMYRGISPLRAAIREYQIHESAQNMNFAMFENMAMPGAVMSTDQTIDKANFERMQKQFEQKYKGKDDAFKTMWLSHGFKYNPVSINPKDLLLVDQMKMTAEDIRMAFKVPKTALLSVDDVKFNNADVTHRIYLLYTIVPKMRRIVDTLNEFFVPMFGQAGLELGFDNPVPEDVKMQAEVAQQIVDIVKTRNELRDEMGLPPIAGGETLYMPFNMVPIGSGVNEQQVRSLEQQNSLLQKQVEALTKERNKIKMLEAHATKN